MCDIFNICFSFFFTSVKSIIAEWIEPNKSLSGIEELYILLAMETISSRILFTSSQCLLSLIENFEASLFHLVKTCSKHILLGAHSQLPTIHSYDCHKQRMLLGWGFQIKINC